MNEAAEIELDPRQIALLERARDEWKSVPPVPPMSDISLDLDIRQERGSRPGERYVRVARPTREGFEKIGPGYLQATARAGVATGGFAAFLLRSRHFLLGQPMASRALAGEKLSKFMALALLSSNPFSSVAYATEQTVTQLIAAGAMAYSFSLPIMWAILILMFCVVASYRQTIKAYPNGGGSYVVARENIGHWAGLIAASALIVDYVLTVAVSVASGVDYLFGVTPISESWRLPICVGLVLIMLVGNLRGVSESAKVFAWPAYFFIASLGFAIAVLAFQQFTGALPAQTPPFAKLLGPTESVSVFLILRAFASGCTALTGVEAISNGVPMFKRPEPVNARRTLTIMGAVSAVLFLGVTVFAVHLGLFPADNTIAVATSVNNHNPIVSQLALRALGNGPAYIFVVATIIGVLILAGNTSFTGFPRLLYVMSRDGDAPHQFKRLGDKLAFSNGILVLAALAIILLVVFGGKTTALIPLYVIGVFVAFTLSQAGMVRRHLRMREKGWVRGLAINATGAVLTAVVFVVSAAVKFSGGAWIVVVVIPLLALVFRAVHNHYADLTSHIQTEIPITPQAVNAVCVVPIADLNPVSLQSLAMARSISDTVVAVHISDNEQDIAELRKKWEIWGNHVPLEIIESPYRSLVQPFFAYLNALDKQRENDTLVVVLPEMVATRWWHHLLHNQSALRLKAALLFRPGTVVVNVPYHVTPRQHKKSGDAI